MRSGARSVLIPEYSDGGITRTKIDASTGPLYVEFDSHFRGARLFLNVASITGTDPSLEVKLSARDPSTGAAVQIATPFIIAPGALPGLRTIEVGPWVEDGQFRKLLQGFLIFEVGSTGAGNVFEFSLGAEFSD